MRARQTLGIFHATLLVLIAAAVAACGSTEVTPGPASPSSAPGPATTGASLSPQPAPPSGTPTLAASPTPGPSTAPTAGPSPIPSPRRTLAPSPGADTSLADTFWSQVAAGIRAARRLEVGIVGPTLGTMRFQADASATVIDGVIGSVCLAGRAYDGQSGFTALPGRWTCGADALVAGFRHIGQPIDAWNATVPSDTARRETVVVRGATWTWEYRAMSAYLGGAVTASVTLDRASGRITSARRADPTGATRYTFHYGAPFPSIAVPH